ncbi:MAG: hypothetical protein ACYTBV_11795 [Planctomycetota bacterium]|jgi:hypothetical protein
MRALKICLWIAGILCLPSVFGMFLPISAWEPIVKFFGAESFHQEIVQIPDSPLVEYAVRVGSATYFATGVYLIILALHPMKYPVLIPFTGLAAIFLGLVCGITGLVAAMPPLWFLGDSLSCLVLGILILVFWQKAKVKQSIEE